MLYTLFPFSLEANLQLHGAHGLKVWNRQHLLLFRSECLCPSAFSGRKRRWHQNYLRIRIRSPSEKQLTSPNIFLFKFSLSSNWLFIFRFSMARMGFGVESTACSSRLFLVRFGKRPWYFKFIKYQNCYRLHGWTETPSQLEVWQNKLVRLEGRSKTTSSQRCVMPISFPMDLLLWQ